MKRVLRNVYILFLAIILSGCTKKGVQYGFLHEQSEISKIEIVMVGEINDQRVNAQEVQCSVEDIDSFLIKFNKVTCREQFPEPMGVSPEQLVVKITYNNGEYELIGRTGQARYTTQYQYVNRVGYYRFDKEEFYELINYYLETADAP